MKIEEAINFGQKMLSTVERPRFEAEILLSFVLKKDRVFLHLNSDKTLEEKDESLYINLLKKRAKNYPLEYITKRVSFYSEEFFIEEGVLIPRPETELLVDRVLENVNKDKNLTIAEIGIGSGVVSIILAKKLKNAKIIATDISKKALNVAKKNIQKHKVEDKIKLLNCSFLDLVDEKVDIIVSNPPYIAKDYKLDENVMFEPKEALFGGEKGDEILKEIIDLAIKRGTKLLACEMGYDQKKSISKYSQKKGLRPIFYKDLAGFDRGFIIKVH